MSEVWDRFSDDPRTPDNAGLRAGDVDRDIVQDVLSQAYAEGRLAPDEHAERSARLAASRTLGELVPLLEGLVRRPTSNLPALAEEKYRRDLREALMGFLTVNIICWGIWLITSGIDSFPWPAFVSLVSAVNLLRVRLERNSRVERSIRKLQKRQRTELPGSED
ncbi:MAG: DUF1707 domain-containing protein [Nocardioides sp.]|uniref:DUF1707 SHOCT-like domain-containing protein n=1 Tax=Nocardioides sp. TaxID=35761 RepID=UPI003F102944